MKSIRSCTLRITDVYSKCFARRVGPVLKKTIDFARNVERKLLPQL